DLEDHSRRHRATAEGAEVLNHLTPIIHLLIGFDRRINATLVASGRMTICRYCPGISWTASALNSPAIRPATKFPSDNDRNQMPIICPTSRRGASLVTELKPTGLRQSS